jgi:PadR family transcriptional regulator PadR
MSKGESLGEFEHLILLAVFRLGDDSYGMRVRREIAERTKRDVTIGAVYSTLERLAAKGLVKSALNDPTPERGGRAKRCFQVTGLGIASLNRARQELGSMLEGIAFPLSGGTR